MLNKTVHIIIVFVVFALGYLIGGEDTKECVAFGGAPQGKYAFALEGEFGQHAWILDTQEGHLWIGGIREGKCVMVYLGQPKTGENVARQLIKEKGAITGLTSDASSDVKPTAEEILKKYGFSTEVASPSKEE